MNDAAELRKERKNIDELEELGVVAANATAKATAPLLIAWLDSVKNATASQLEKSTIPTANTSAIQEAAFQLVASSYMLGLIHAQEEEPGTNLADDIIPAIPFAEAITFLSAKIPLTKAEWEKLEPMIRFRAFTVALLGYAHEIEAAKQILIKSLEEGTSYRDTWYELKKKLEKNESIAPYYWENVYRTNTQSAYVAGKLEQYQNSGVVAYQLMVIEDSRTTAICRNLLSKTSGYGAVIPVNDKFWEQHGFPPYHYQCRTSIRGIWKSQLRRDTKVDTRQTAPNIKTFEPMEGFGGNPAQEGLWGQETESQRKQAVAYGLQEQIDAARERLVERTSIEVGIPKPVHSIEDFQKMETPLSIAEAMKQVNPNYSDGFEWQNNCQRCCPTYETIRRGYDVTAKPVSVNNSAELSNDKYTDYTTNAFALMFKDADIINAKGFGKKEIKQAMKTWGDGARCEICIVNAEWFCHIFMAEQVDGKTIFLDPQTNQVYDESVFDHVKKGYTKYFRTDNLDFTDSIIDCCQNRKGAKK